MKNIPLYVIILLAFTGCQPKADLDSYPDAEAVYLTLSKTYTLHADGSMEYAFYKEQVLLTHRAFHSLYGQTDIYYNPETDSVVVEVAETQTPDGRVVPVPDNGYVDMIPAYATGSAAFSHLKHKAVVHTALEREAVIRSGYTVYQAAGSAPALAGREYFELECPVRTYELTVRVPKGEPFRYRSVAGAPEPRKTSRGGYDVYTWRMQDVEQSSAEPMGIRFDRHRAQVVFSSGADFFEAFNAFTSQKAFTFETSVAMREQVSRLTGNLADPYRKIGALQRLVTDEIQHNPVPLSQADYQVRDAIQTWEGMSGTSEEKSILLTALIRSLGMEAVPVAFVPAYIFTRDTLPEPLGPIDLLAFSHVLVKLDGSGLYLDVNRTHQTDPVHRYPGHLVIPLEMGYSQVNMNPVPEADYQLAWDGTLELERNRLVMHGSFEGNYIGRINPFQGLSLFPETLNRLYPGSAAIEVMSPRSTLISFERTFENEIQLHGKKIMFDLPLNHSGFDSWGITYLPDERSTPMELPSTLREFQRLQISLPPMVHPVDFDRDITISNDLGRVSIRYAARGGELSVLRNLNLAVREVSPETYPQLKALLDPWINPIHKQIILER